MSFNHSELTKRFQNDPHFNNAVKTIINMIELHGFTPSELREVLFFAHYCYEMDNPKKVMTCSTEKFLELIKHQGGKY